MTRLKSIYDIGPPCFIPLSNAMRRELLSVYDNDGYVFSYWFMIGSMKSSGRSFLSSARLIDSWGTESKALLTSIGHKQPRTNNLIVGSDRKNRFNPTESHRNLTESRSTEIFSRIRPSESVGITRESDRIRPKISVDRDSVKFRWDPIGSWKIW